MRLVLTAFLLVAAAGAAVLASPAARTDHQDARPYIVTVRTGPPAAVVPPGARPKHVYRATIRGFAADLTPAQVRRLRRDPRVGLVEPDHRLRVAAVPWGLDRVGQRRLPLDGRFTPPGTGAGATAYVVDTGIEVAHREFEGRARSFWDFEPANRGRDCLGHGTHVAGIIGARTYGVARKVALRGVRVIGCKGYGNYSDIIAGLDRIGTASGLARSVVNLSLAGPSSTALNTAVVRLMDKGAYVVVAAGNNNGDACGLSPSNAPRVLTVAASDQADARAGFSNKGSCVELYAPGVAIPSTYPGGRTQLMSGTSMASPHAAGVAALYKAASRTPNAVSSWMLNSATTGAIRGNPGGTPNKLLYIGSLR